MNMKSTGAHSIIAVVFCLGLVAGATPPPSANAAKITEIRLERNCFGCSSGSLLVLRPNGTTMYTTTGTARSGTTGHVSEGRIQPQDFARIARMIESQGFFHWAEVYGDPQLQDGPWVAVTVVRNGREKKVVSRDQAGPHGLQTIIAAIDDLQARAQLATASRR